MGSQHVSTPSVLRPQICNGFCRSPKNHHSPLPDGLWVLLPPPKKMDKHVYIGPCLGTVTGFRQAPKHVQYITLPKTKIAPEKMASRKARSVFQPAFLTGNVSFRGCKMILEYVLTHQRLHISKSNKEHLLKKLMFLLLFFKEDLSGEGQ